MVAILMMGKLRSKRERKGERGRRKRRESLRKRGRQAKTRIKRGN